MNLTKVHTDSMIIRQGFKYRLDTSDMQSARLRVLCGHARYVWNKALSECNQMLATEGQYVPRYETMAKWVTAWKREPETEWLKEAYTDNLQQKLKDLDTAWQRYFKKIGDAGRPQAKKKGRSRDSVRFVNFAKYCTLNGNRVKLPAGLGWVRFRRSRKIQGEIKNCTVGYEAGHWFISFQTEREIEKPVPQATAAVGIDMGVARFATLSDGSHLEPLNSFKQHESALRRAQQAMSRKVKFSNNWKKAKARVQKIHSRIGNVRRDYLHKATTTISKNHAMVCVENLQVRNMSASAAGTTEQPGKNVRAKSGLNKAILDQGWFEFRRQLEYKQELNGGWFVAVPPHNTSRTCPACGHVSKDNRRSQAEFNCVECGFEENADVVGAINVLRRGEALLSTEGQDIARFACEVNGAVRPSAAGTC